MTVKKQGPRAEDICPPKARIERRNLSLLMIKARDGIADFFRPILKENGLTEQQWRVLRDLYENGESSVGQVSKRCHILGPSLTGMLNRMRTSKLLKQRFDSTDQRRYFITLTKTGQKKFEKLAPLIEDKYREIDALFGADEIKRIYDQLDSIIKRTNKSP